MEQLRFLVQSPYHGFSFIDEMKNKTRRGFIMTKKICVGGWFSLGDDQAQSPF